MKLKLTLMAVGATLALGYQAQASIGTTTSYEKLNVSLTVTTNAAETDNGNTYHITTHKAKITNKDLLNLFAHWSENDRTVEPWKSAQLVMAWDWEQNVLVVDKTGTNVLYNASSDYGDTDTHYFILDYYNDQGAINESGSDSTDAYNYTQWNNGSFQILDDNFYLDYTDLFGNGSATDTYSQNADESKWHESFDFNADGADVWLNDFGGWDGDGGTLSGHINGDGHNL